LIADRFANIELSLIRQINALATSESINLGIGEPNLEPDETFHEFARRAATTSWHYSPNAGNVSLRKKLGDPGLIETVRGVGLRLRNSR
jgi:aspartate aminotransferase